MLVVTVGPWAHTVGSTLVGQGRLPEETMLILRPEMYGEPLVKGFSEVVWAGACVGRDASWRRDADVFWGRRE